ncbi:MAG: hypothetical protein ACK5JO_16335 [Halodesulfovibrio sp.]
MSDASFESRLMQIMGSPKVKSSELFAKTVRITKGHSKRLDKIGKRMGVKPGVLLRYLVEMSIDLLEPSKEPKPEMEGVNMEGSDRLTIIESRLDKLEVMIQELTSSTLSHAMTAKEGGEEILEARGDDSGDAGAINSSAGNAGGGDSNGLHHGPHVEGMENQIKAEEGFDMGGMEKCTPQEQLMAKNDNELENRGGLTDYSTPKLKYVGDGNVTISDEYQRDSRYGNVRIPLDLNRRIKR